MNNPTTGDLQLSAADATETVETGRTIKSKAGTTEIVPTTMIANWSALPAPDIVTE